MRTDPALKGSQLDIVCGLLLGRGVSRFLQRCLVYLRCGQRQTDSLLLLDGCLKVKRRSREHGAIEYWVMLLLRWVQSVQELLALALGSVMIDALQAVRSHLLRILREHDHVRLPRYQTFKLQSHAADAF